MAEKKSTERVKKHRQKLKENNMKKICFYVKEEDKETVKQRAREKGMTFSDYLAKKIME